MSSKNWNKRIKLWPETHSENFLRSPPLVRVMAKLSAYLSMGSGPIYHFPSLQFNKNWIDEDPDRVRSRRHEPNRTRSRCSVGSSRTQRSAHRSVFSYGTRTRTRKHTRRLRTSFARG